MIEALSDTERAAVSEGLRAHERVFLSSHPDYARVLDVDRITRYVDERLSSARRVEQPVPHLVVTEALEPAFHEVLEAAWPPDAVFKRDARDRKRDLVPSAGTGVDTRNAGYDLLPAAIRRVWDFFVFTVNRTIVGPRLARLFSGEIEARLQLLKRAQEEGLIGYQMAGAGNWSYQANVGRFMVRGNGYVLKPHLDSMPYLVTVLHYFPEADSDQHASGTVFYEPTTPLDFDACVRDGSTQYFDRAGVECREVLRVPYARNTMLAFPNTLSAAHGVVAPEHGYRRVFQYHLSLKGDDEKV
jgi:hypothetical protein